MRRLAEAKKRRNAVLFPRQAVSSPFDLSIDLAFLYQSEGHERAFSETLKAIERREGLVCITGEPGTGKSLLCQRLLAEMPDPFQAILLPTPPATPDDITAAVDENVDEARGRIPVLIIDEAQQLSPACLDHIKILWNLRRDEANLLHIVLVGQPELIEKFSQRHFKPLAQRVGANLVLKGLRRREVLPYVNRRLSRAELSEFFRFTQGSAKRLFKSSSGIPRLVNRIAAVSIERAVAKGKGKIRARDVRRAEKMLSLIETREPKPGRARRWLLAGSMAALGAVFTLFFYGPSISSIGTNLLALSGVHTDAEGRRYGIKIGTFLGQEEAREATTLLAADGFRPIFREEGLADGWAVVGAYLWEPMSRAEAEKTASILRGRYGVEAYVVTLPPYLEAASGLSFTSPGR